MSGARAHHLGGYAVVTASVAHYMSVGQRWDINYFRLARYLVTSKSGLA